MTWNEFKAAVDKALAEQGTDGEIQVWYIETHDDGDKVIVEVDPEYGLAVVLT